MCLFGSSVYLVTCLSVRLTHYYTQVKHASSKQTHYVCFSFSAYIHGHRAKLLTHNDGWSKYSREALQKRNGAWTQCLVMRLRTSRSTSVLGHFIISLHTSTRTAISGHTSAKVIGIGKAHDKVNGSLLHIHHLLTV